MSISKSAFEAEFRKLWDSLGPGTKLNLRRMDAYFEELGDFLDEASWARIVTHVRRTHDVFPKIPTLLDIITPRARTTKSPEQEFIDDDCKVIECIGGVIRIERDGYSAVARCPRCDRGPGGLPVYRGVVTLRSEQEMFERRSARSEAMRDRRVVLARTKALVNQVADELDVF